MTYNTETILKDFPDVMTVADITKALNIGRNAAYLLIKNGSISALKIGGSIRILKVNVIDFLENSCYNSSSSEERVLVEKGED